MYQSKCILAILRFVLFGNDIRVLTLPKGFDPLVRSSSCDIDCVLPFSRYSHLLRVVHGSHLNINGTIHL
jgi:hypothetical protein